MKRLAILLLCLVAGPLGAAPAPLDAAAALAVSEEAIGREVGAHRLRDHAGRPLDLAALRGRPLVISLVFTRCASVCPTATDRLREAVTEARRVLGSTSFEVLTFGFDARRDTPAALTAFADAHELDISGWRLASADPDTTARLLAKLGFSYRAAAGGFEHVTQTTILDAGGRVYRHVYGEDFPLPVFVEPLKELVFGLAPRSLAPQDLWARIRFLCTVYSPSMGAYRFDYGIFFGIAIGGASLLLTIGLVIRLWWTNRRPRAAAAAAGGAEG
ncbi:SCO family protein [Roseomonas sp. HF4]|uniref:SCO family protein n=1 Tax=Roseomonas sp. HF4 TaxID=2562313 RepID=UPI0010BF9860|nr:SCO family protein [Roseomonas sp. HF4]